METVICSVCELETPVGAYCQKCKQRLLAKVAAAPVEAPERPASALQRCPTPGCGQELPPGATSCGYCGEPVAGAAGAVALVFPWGPRLLDEGEAIELGRGCPPYANELAAYPNVGRRHARIAHRNSALLVTDLKSLNHTYVDDRELPAGTATELRRGQVLRLGADLEIEIG